MCLLFGFTWTLLVDRDNVHKARSIMFASNAYGWKQKQLQGYTQVRDWMFTHVSLALFVSPTLRRGLLIGSQDCKGLRRSAQPWNRIDGLTAWGDAPSFAWVIHQAHVLSPLAIWREVHALGQMAFCLNSDYERVLSCSVKTCIVRWWNCNAFWRCVISSHL